LLLGVALKVALVPFVETFQYADIAVGFDQRLPAALSFRGEQDRLLGKVLVTRFEQQFVSLRFEQLVDVRVLAGRCRAL
jgi:hypothetical protein